LIPRALVLALSFSIAATSACSSGGGGGGASPDAGGTPSPDAPPSIKPVDAGGDGGGVMSGTFADGSVGDGAAVGGGPVPAVAVTVYDIPGATPAAMFAATPPQDQTGANPRDVRATSAGLYFWLVDSSSHKLGGDKVLRMSAGATPALATLVSRPERIDAFFPATASDAAPAVYWVAGDSFGVSSGAETTSMRFDLTSYQTAIAPVGGQPGRMWLLAGEDVYLSGGSDLGQASSFFTKMVTAMDLQLESRVAAADNTPDLFSAGSLTEEDPDRLSLLQFNALNGPRQYALPGSDVLMEVQYAAGAAWVSALERSPAGDTTRVYRFADGKFTSVFADKEYEKYGAFSRMGGQFCTDGKVLVTVGSAGLGWVKDLTSGKTRAFSASAPMGEWGIRCLHDKVADNDIYVVNFSQVFRIQLNWAELRK
jgi:hypothetical protein